MKRHVLIKTGIIMAFILFLLAGCTEKKCSQDLTNDEEQASAPDSFQNETADKKDTMVEESTDVHEEEPMKAAKKRVELQSQMISFWTDHQDEMEAFARQMKVLDESDDGQHTYLYAVKEDTLYQFSPQSRTGERIEDHQNLTDTLFFGKAPVIDWVSWNDGWLGFAACSFTGEVYDEDEGKLYAELYLLYSEETPVTNDYQTVEPLAENWYFYCDYRE